MKAHIRFRAILLSWLCLGLASATDVHQTVLMTTTNCSTTAVVNNQDALTSLAQACKNYTGVLVATDFSGELSLDGFEHIEALYIEDNPHLTSIDAKSLTSSVSFNVIDAPNLSAMSFSNLSSVEEFRLKQLPALSQLNLTTTIKPTDSLIVTNTSLSSLDGIDPARGVDIILHFNENLQTITFSTPTMGDIFLTGNDDTHVSFPNLTWAGSLNINNVSAISMPLLESAYYIFVYDGNMTTFSLPSLQEVQEMLYLNGLTRLSELSLPKLTRINIRHGALVMMKSGLVNLTLESLESVEGHILLGGNFETVSLPKLTQMGQSFQVLRGGKNLDCDALSAWYSSIDVRYPQFLCRAGEYEYDEDDLTEEDMMVHPYTGSCVPHPVVEPQPRWQRHYPYYEFHPVEYYWSSEE